MKWTIKIITEASNDGRRCDIALIYDTNFSSLSKTQRQCIIRNVFTVLRRYEKIPFIIFTCRQNIEHACKNLGCLRGFIGADLIIERYVTCDPKYTGFSKV